MKKILINILSSRSSVLLLEIGEDQVVINHELHFQLTHTLCENLPLWLEFMASQYHKNWPQIISIKMRKTKKKEEVV